MRFHSLLLLGFALVGACAGPRENSAISGASLNGASSTPQIVPWGDGPSAVGFRPAVAERLAWGAPALGVAPTGEPLVLDALHGRIVRVLEGGGLAPVARVERDADDFAVSSDGALAVRHSTTNQIDVLTPSGERIGALDASLVRDVDTVVLGPSRRVSVVSPFQETFTLGSPSAPLSAEATLLSKREGAAFLADRTALSVVRREDGVVELDVLGRDEARDRSVVRARHGLGEASSGRIVGTSGNAACLRLEHVTTAASGALEVRREAVCVDVISGKHVLRVELPPVGTYVPRRELAVGAGRLYFMHPEAGGLAISSHRIEGGAR